MIPNSGTDLLSKHDFMIDYRKGHDHPKAGFLFYPSLDIIDAIAATAYTYNAQLAAASLVLRDS